MRHQRSPPVGRFAPSPTGDLHFGSLLAAVASYAQVKSSGGLWLLRIEDLDPPREVPGSAARIEADLLRFGMRSDRPVLYQGARTADYRNALQELLERDQAYWCGCSRADLPASGVYPGTCRNGLRGGKRRRAARLKVAPEPVRFTDLVQGECTESLSQGRRRAACKQPCGSWVNPAPSGSTSTGPGGGRWTTGACPACRADSRFRCARSLLPPADP